MVCFFPPLKTGCIATGGKESFCRFLEAHLAVVFPHPFENGCCRNSLRAFALTARGLPDRQIAGMDASLELGL